MKLLLTSAGLANEKITNFFISQFDKLSGKKACVVTSGRSEEEQLYIDESIKELEDLGIKVFEVNIAKNDNFPNLEEFDIYYVCGGNTFYILDRMRKTGIDKVLISAIKKEKFYLGVSAGSIIPGTDIEISGWGESGDSNDVNLQDLKGFGLAPCIISPHYTEKEKPGIDSFKEKRKGEQIIPLTDEQAVFVEDNNVILI